MLQENLEASKQQTLDSLDSQPDQLQLCLQFEEKSFDIRIEKMSTIQELLRINFPDQIPDDLWVSTPNGRMAKLHEHLNDLGIRDRETLVLSSKIKGGGIQAVMFNSLEKEKLGRFSSLAPKWRILDRGLNLEGQCKNKECEAYTKLVLIQHGFGDKFNLARLVTESECPQCKQCAENVNLPYFFLCKVIIEGKLINSPKKIRKDLSHVDPKNFLTFDDADDQIIKWSWLEISVMKL